MPSSRNADGGGGSYDREGRTLGFSLGAAEKVYQTYSGQCATAAGTAAARAQTCNHDLADGQEAPGASLRAQLNRPHEPITRAAKG